MQVSKKKDTDKMFYFLSFVNLTSIFYFVCAIAISYSSYYFCVISIIKIIFPFYIYMKGKSYYM